MRKISFYIALVCVILLSSTEVKSQSTYAKAYEKARAKQEAKKRALEKTKAKQEAKKRALEIKQEAKKEKAERTDPFDAMFEDFYSDPFGRRRIDVKIDKQIVPEQTISQPQSEIVNAPSSDVDVDIPSFGATNKTTFAIVIANEDYQRESKVDFAKNDGKTFQKYCHQVLGLPEKNIHLIENGTLNNMIYELDWLEQVCKAYDGEASVIFYYAGHGVPDEADGKAYLLPIDGTGKNLRTCLSTEELYKTLGGLPAKSVTVLMDACFSGAKRSGEMLASARGVAIQAKTSAPKGNMVVLSAAQGDETAYSYKDTQHGLFTYFLLKKLKESKGAATLGELAEYVETQVKRFSIVENGKMQTPTIIPSSSLMSSWQNLKLK
jgi:Uncharacterized protein containing caspase domain